MGSEKQRKLTSTRVLLLWAELVWFEGINSHREPLRSFCDLYSRFLQAVVSFEACKKEEISPDLRGGSFEL